MKKGYNSVFAPAQSVENKAYTNTNEPEATTDTTEKKNPVGRPRTSTRVQATFKISEDNLLKMREIAFREKQEQSNLLDLALSMIIEKFETKYYGDSDMVQHMVVKPNHRHQNVS